MSHNPCRTCKFFEPSPGDPSNLKKPMAGTCHRYPPHPQVLGAQPMPGGVMLNTQPVWPPVMADFWCGEWDGTLDFKPLGMPLRRDAAPVGTGGNGS